MRKLDHGMVAGQKSLERTGRLLVCVMGCFLLILASGCTPPPVQEMSDARQTIHAARAAGAAHCAAAELVTTAAQRWLENASYALRIHDYPMADRSARRARRRAYDALIMLHAIAPPPGTPNHLLLACPARGKR